MKKIDWVTSSFLILTPLISIIFVPIYLAHNGWDWSLFWMFFVFWALTEVSITAGYHRYFAHRSYQAKGWVDLFFVIVGAAAFQGSILKWATDHRRHHLFVDTDKDPYNIKRGFWFAHIGWLLLDTDPEYKGKYASDLAVRPLLRFQNKYYGIVATLSGFGLPLLVGWSIGKPWGGLLFGGVLRVVIAHHCTFFINSFCHLWGRQPYSDQHSAKDSLLMALFTFGEGYHNFHHEFQIDYRNGVRWYQWDPTKWFINSLSYVGCVEKLKRVPREMIVRARVLQDAKRLSARGVQGSRLEELKTKVLQTQEDFRKLRLDWTQRKEEFRKSSQERFLQMKADLRITRLEFKKSYAQWKAYVRTMKAFRIPDPVA